MNDINTEATVVETPNFVIDEHGNRVEVPFDVSNGEAAPEETKVFIAEDAPDHITVH
jgi:hypothetical protein